MSSLFSDFNIFHILLEEYIYSFVFANKPRRFFVQDFSICVEKIKCSLFLVQFLIAIDANEPE